jgi:hypothetical protein
LKKELSFHHQIYENIAMTKDKEPFEVLTATAAQTEEQITKQTQGAMEIWLAAKDYVNISLE